MMKSRTQNRIVNQMLNDMWNNDYSMAARCMGQHHAESDTARPVWRPALDIVEREDDVNIRVNLPGLKSEDVTVEVEGNLLTITGDNTPETEDDTRYFLRERRVGAFKRKLRLPDTLDAEGISAAFDNGVLNLSIPRLPETQPKRINIEMA